MADVLMQAVSDPESVGGDGELYAWVSDGTDFTAAGFPGPGDPIYIAVSCAPVIAPPATGGGGGLPEVVASASGDGEDDEDEGATVFTYEVPEGAAGLYRLTGFVGPLSSGGSGQVQLRTHWDPYQAGSGNLAFTAPGDGSGIVQVASLEVGESTQVLVNPLTWLANEGDTIACELNSTFDGGSWLWRIVLEYIGPTAT